MNNLFAGLSALTPSSVASTPSSETPQDIPKEELMNLCMKMNKRMQAMETKGKELVKKKSVLLSERQKLLDLLRSVIPVPMLTKEDVDLDLVSIEQSWLEFESRRRDHTAELEDRVSAKEQLMQQSLRAMEEQYKKIINDLKANQSTEVKAVPSADGFADPLLNIGGGASTNGLPAADNETTIAAIIEAEREKMAAQSAMQELQKRVTKADAEVDRLKGVEAYLKQQLSTMEGVINAKNTEIEALQREAESNKTTYEEKIVYLQMQLTSSKGKDESRDKESVTHKATVDKLTAQIAALQRLIEEKDLSYKSNKDMIVALQARLIELEPELAQSREKIAQAERNLSAQSMLKVEQGALTNSLRADLKASLDELDAARKRNRELEEYKVKAEGQLLKMAALGEQVHTLQSGMEDKDSLITRMRTEQQVSERNHAMRTAMLATCEAQLETVTQELASRDATTQEAIERVTSLQTALAACESRLAERVREAATEIAALEAKIAAIEQDREVALASLEKIQEEALEAQKRDHAKKAAMARTLLSEREEEVRVLSAKVQELQEEISSGAPTERKIFELALSQSKRESLHGVHNDTREIAFAQVQSKLAAKDLELARVQQNLASLQAEVVDLRRTRQRDGINMDYLKNVVIQYMTFPAQSSEKMSLVPVLAMLLQFTPKELSVVQRCALVEAPSAPSIWSSLGLSSSTTAAPAYSSSRVAKEVKRPTGAVIGSPEGVRPGALLSTPPSSGNKATAPGLLNRTPSAGAGMSSATLTAAALVQNSLTHPSRSPVGAGAQGSVGPTPSRHIAGAQSGAQQTPSGEADTAASRGYQPPSVPSPAYSGNPLSPSTSNSDVEPSRAFSPPKPEEGTRKSPLQVHQPPQGQPQQASAGMNTSQQSALMVESHTDNGTSADPNFDTPLKKGPDTATRRTFGSGSFKGKPGAGTPESAKKGSMNRMLQYRASSMNNSEYEFQQKLRSIGSDILSLDNSMSYDDGDIDATYVDVEDGVLEDVPEEEELDDGLDGTSV